MTEELTTTNINMVNMTENIKNITTMVTLMGEYDQKLIVYQNLLAKLMLITLYNFLMLVCDLSDFIVPSYFTLKNVHQIHIQNRPFIRSSYKVKFGHLFLVILFSLLFGIPAIEII